jgi:DNA (cytosine-5)-methyltransferase 1
VTTLDGEALMAAHPFDLVSFGAPCQDLSVAGKRAGLDGARSSLFFDGVRIWNESGATYALYENVYGALSSNNGADFARVLSALVGAAVPVPRDGWRRGGVASGPAAVAAWRVLDLQHVFGDDWPAPPQRRVRVFVLAARAGAVDPAEVLALSEGVCGHLAPREQAREGVARGAAAGVGGGGVVRTQTVGGRDKGAGDSVDNTPVIVAIGVNNDSRAEAVVKGVASLRGGARAPASVLAFHHTQDPIGGGKPGQGYPAVLAFGIGSHAGAADGEATNNSHAGGGPVGMGITEEYVNSLRAERTSSVVCITGPVTHSLTHEGADASEDGTGRGTPIVVPTLSMGAHTAAPGSNGQDALEYAAITTGLFGRPRRLTPLECERLMAWPDGHTARGIDEKGREYALSDTARYRLCGNGIGSTQAEWIGRNLMALEAEATAQVAA